MAPMLISLPCVDSDELAQRWKRILNLPRGEAARLGRSAVEAIERGSYMRGDGTTVDWSGPIAAARSARVSIPPGAELPAAPSRTFPATRVQVRNETTLVAARRLVEQGARPLALNFANGIHPGGGFLVGARAQEECLCRSSALFATLQGDPMYAAHLARERPDSTAWAIYSPDVPVFRDDAGTPLDAPWPLAFLTCAAPLAPVVGADESARLLRERIHRVLAIARAFGHAELVLGAWGCGAFGNDGETTARDFREALEGPFANAFAEVVFAITDWSTERRMLGPFRDALGPGDPPA